MVTAGVLALTAYLLLQEREEPPQAQVDLAINKGLEYLHSAAESHTRRVELGPRNIGSAELVLYTYLHAGVPLSDAGVQALWRDLQSRPLQATYEVALQAMILEKLGAAIRPRMLLRCAQWLADNQLVDGSWSYGSRSVNADALRIPDGETALDDPRRASASRKPNLTRVEKRAEGSGRGDHSNSQYAALGLRACHDGGIRFPASLVELASKSWTRSLRADGRETLELDLSDSASRKSAVRLEVLPAGWCYGPHSDHRPYGSMTAGAVGALCILDYMRAGDDGRSRSWKRDPAVLQGLAWLARSFSVHHNPGPYEAEEGFENDSQQYLYYYLYALERAGSLFGTARIGTRVWYAEGARRLIALQSSDGMWGDGAWDTCWAILFLRRSTRPLDVASIDPITIPKRP
jgi:hypothetical protein